VAAVSTAHQPPFYCPYCGEEDIRPADKHGEWTCASCRRAWALRFLGLTTTPDPADPGARLTR
jgi:hypothetical protein